MNFMSFLSISQIFSGNGGFSFFQKNPWWKPWGRFFYGCMAVPCAGARGLSGLSKVAHNLVGAAPSNSWMDALLLPQGARSGARHAELAVFLKENQFSLDKPFRTGEDHLVESGCPSSFCEIHILQRGWKKSCTS